MDQDSGSVDVSGRSVTACAGWPEIDDLGESKAWPNGTELLQQGIIESCLFLLISGLVKEVHRTLDGKPVVVGLRYPGWLLGTASLSKEREPVSIITVTGCRTRWIPIELLQRRLQFQPALWRRVIGQNSVQARDLYRSIAEMGSLSSRLRLGRLLADMASAGSPQRDDGKPVRLELPVKYWELAQMLGVTESYLSRLFNQLESAGILQREDRALIIPRISRLTHPER